MKQKVLFGLIMLLIFSSGIWADEPPGYPPKVAKVMWGSVEALNAINEGLDEGDYFEVALRFVELAELFKELEDVNPPKGSKAEWIRIHEKLIQHAFRAIGACADENKKAIEKELGAIKKLQKEGHGIFR